MNDYQTGFLAHIMQEVTPMPEDKLLSAINEAIWVKLCDRQRSIQCNTCTTRRKCGAYLLMEAKLVIERQQRKIDALEDALSGGE